MGRMLRGPSSDERLRPRTLKDVYITNGDDKDRRPIWYAFLEHPKTPSREEINKAQKDAVALYALDAGALHDCNGEDISKVREKLAGIRKVAQARLAMGYIS